ncbi:unnamed protein product [Didymodactylos carnosus]|uniref:PRISE-like Rossmann-fold domain-containing protein n=1 Tax=Didymodactylos carnosus TaxID=1234261 RepID=A0A8S2F0V0_9BILA|nr:unnamed protein product [Didymodactylos carnosus]CAF4175110.1 unnamed protein product [Didymodactylos carnosus]
MCNHFTFNVYGGQEVTHAYHFTYVAKNSEQELDNVNKELLCKALEATKKVARENLQVFLLQTGYKYYGTHKGGEYLAPRPFYECTPRHKGLNFYYTQEDKLKEEAKKSNFSYIITRPNIIIGASKGNFMNFAVSIALYACIQKELGKPLIFPGNQVQWDSLIDHSDVCNDAQFELWASVTKEAENQEFNIHNGDYNKFRVLWPKIAKYFDIPVGEPSNKDPPPKNGEVKCQMPLVEYMKDKKDVWKRIAHKYSLDESAFDYATWDFADAIVGRAFDEYGDMSKARKLGWNKYVDTGDSYLRTFDRLKKLKIIP